MRAPVEIPTMRRSQRIYGCLLTLYPRAHREEYGLPMVQLFRDQARDAWREAQTWGLMRLWFRVLLDLLKSSMLEHVAALKGRKSMADKIAALNRPNHAPLKTFLKVALPVFVLVFALATVITLLLPESYASVARIKVEQTSNATTSAVPAHSYDPYFVQTEFEVLQSEAVLGQVVDRLQLNSAWGKKYSSGGKLKTAESIALLKGRLDLRPVRNTSLIEIRVFSDDREEAASIANTIADSYRDYREGARVKALTSGIQALEDRFQEQQEKIRQTQGEIERLQKTLGISELDGQSAAVPRLDAEVLRRVQTQQLETSQRAGQLRLSLAKLRALNKEELKRVLPRMRPDQLLTELLSKLNLAEQELTGLKAEFSPQHPNYVRVKEMIEGLNKKVDDSIAGILTSMENELEVTESSAAAVQKQIETARAADVERATQTRPYFEKKRALEEAQNFGRVLGMKLASEKIDAALPPSRLVEIIDRAVASLRPMRPNKPLNFALGAFGGLMLGLCLGGLAALFGSWIRRQPPTLPTAPA
jgi:polysaccharide biosynthesis transport protein